MEGYGGKGSIASPSICHVMKAAIYWPIWQKLHLYLYLYCSEHALWSVCLAFLWEMTSFGYSVSCRNMSTNSGVGRCIWASFLHQDHHSRAQVTTCPHPCDFLQVLQEILLRTHNVPGTVLHVGGAGLSVPSWGPHVMKTQRKGTLASSGNWGRLPGGRSIEIGMWGQADRT